MDNFMRVLFVLVAVLLLFSSNSSATSYVYGPDGLIAKVNESGNITYFHSDHLGSTNVITNEAGEVVQEQVNLPFGERISGGERYGFTGKELDETELNYFGARYYSPESGRFLTTDPVMQYYSPYIYAGNNPNKYVDPDGQAGVLVPVLGAAAVTAGGGGPPGWAIAAAIIGGVGLGIGIGEIIHHFTRDDIQPEPEVIRGSGIRHGPEVITKEGEPPTTERVLPAPGELVKGGVPFPSDAELWRELKLGGERIEPPELKIPTSCWAADVKQSGLTQGQTAIIDYISKQVEGYPEGKCVECSNHIFSILKDLKDGKINMDVDYKIGEIQLRWYYPGHVVVVGEIDSERLLLDKPGVSYYSPIEQCWVHSGFAEANVGYMGKLVDAPSGYKDRGITIKKY